jgi:hypothetical protein
MNGGIINSVTRLHLVGCFYWIKPPHIFCVHHSTEPYSRQTFLTCVIFITLLPFNQNHMILTVEWSWHTKHICILALTTLKVTTWVAEICWQSLCNKITFLIIKPTRCINFSNLFLEWNCTCFSNSSSVHHQEFFTVHTAMVYVIQARRIKLEHPDPACKLSANLYDIYHCCVYSEKLLMMDRGTVRNM